MATAKECSLSILGFAGVFCSVGVYVGAVLGTIIVILFLVGLICCCVRGAKRGQVVTTQPLAMSNTGVAVVSGDNSSSQYPGYNPGYGQPMGAQPMGAQPMGAKPMQPPPYSGPAPAYGYPNPAYPPAGTHDPYTNAGFEP